ncbi:MAG: NAD-dependent epimerase/dehydratase family protein [Phycisphaerae bacterium]|nr:NAD-dependent epimerase/dehydratase family protein [Phycisphaerae bacterium]
MSGASTTPGLALVTGGAGFIGSNVAVALAASGWNVRAVDSMDPECGGNRANLRGSNARLLESDLRDQERANAAVAGASLVVHCAASTSHGRSVREPFADLDANAAVTLRVLEAVRTHAPTARVIHLSTTTQSGPLSRVPADESHPDAPIDVYSSNRLAAERYAIIYHLVHGLRTTALRLPNVYGPRACLTTPQLTFNNWFIGCALRNEPITIWGDGAQLRSIMHVDDAVSAVLAAVACEASVGQVLLATPRTPVSVAEFAHATVRAVGSGRVEFTPWPQGRRSIDVGDAVFDPSRAERMLQWSARTPLDAGLRSTAQFFREHAADYGAAATRG